MTHNPRKTSVRKPLPRAAGKSVPPPRSTLSIFSRLNHFGVNWKYLYFALSAITLAVMLALAPYQGVAGDEPIDGCNGRAALAYYTQGDTSFANFPQSQYTVLPDSALFPDRQHNHPPLFQKYYGVGFEILPAIAVKYLGMGRYEYELRHILCALFAFLMFFFCGLIGRELRNYKTAILCLLTIALTPGALGHAYIASKDVPVGAGFAIAVYAFIRIFRALPKMRPRDLLLAAAGIAIAVSVRLNGLMLLFYFAAGMLLVFAIKKQLRHTLCANITLSLKVIGILTAAALVGTFAGLCFYPNTFYEGPISHVKNGLTMLSKFPYCLPFNWNGEWVNSCRLPKWYLLSAYKYCLPLFVMGSAALFVLNIRRLWRRCDRFALIFLFFTFAFPVAYLIVSHSPLYNGWRHTLFAYPMFVPFCAIGVYETSQWAAKGLKRIVWQCAVAALFGIGIMPVIKWLVPNYKYAYAYYNEFAGNPRQKFDLDFVGLSQSISLDWLIANKLTDTSRQYTILTNAHYSYHYIYSSKGHHNIKFVLGGFRTYAAQTCDYAILTEAWMPREKIPALFPLKPAKNVLHTEKIGRNPICITLEKNPLDAQGIRLVQQNKFAEGIAALEQAYADNPSNFGLWRSMAHAYFYTGKYDKAIEFYKKSISFWAAGDEILFGYAHIGAALVNKNKYDEALPYLLQALKINGGKNSDIEDFVNANAGLAHYHKKEYNKALPYLERCVAHYPHLQGILQVCRQQAK